MRVRAKLVIQVTLLVAIVIAGARVAKWSLLPRWNTAATRIRWKQTLPGVLTSSPALGSDGSIYVTTRNGSIYGLNRSGAVRWTYHPGLGEIPTALLLDEENNLYFSTQKRVLSLTASGKKRWEAPCSPAKSFLEAQAGALGEGVLYATCGENLNALNASNGNELWSEPVFESEPFVVALRSAIVSPRTWSLVASDTSGAPMWHFPPPNYVPAIRRPGLTTDDPFFSSPIAVGGDETLYTGSGDGEFSAFGSDGSLKWTHDFGALRNIRFTSSPVIAADGTVIVMSTNAVVYALATDGSLRWFFNVDRPPFTRISQPSPLLGSDGTIYILSALKLYGLSPAGKDLWEQSLSADSEVSPTIAPDGMLYVSTSDGVLYAVRTESKGLMNSPWPKYQHDVANSGRQLFAGSK